MKAKYAGKCPRCKAYFKEGAEIISDNNRWYPVDCESCAKLKVDLNSLIFNYWDTTFNTITHLEINCQTGFERGNAHEDVGVEWTLTLPNIPHHWMSTTGWRKGSTDKPINFTATSLMQVVNKAVEFLIWYKEQRVKQSQIDSESDRRT